MTMALMLLIYAIRDKYLKPGYTSIEKHLLLSIRR
ncbi:hypothetical protein Syn8016DRAFT_2302 [Synechococcus sp. WH 8016]|nr:hypothetical protein Syn8016DRAFT_2302 [Synechococcus sp. WH 8016]